MPDIHDDVRAALDASRDPSAINPGEANDDFAPQRTEVLPPVMPDGKEPPKAPETKGPQPRAPDGKFQRTDASVPGQPAPSAKAGEESSDLSEEEDEEEDHFDPAKPPSSWTKEMKGKWSTLPEDVRTEIMRREEATAFGVQKLMQHYEPMEPIYNAVAQYGQYFNHIQADVGQYIDQMVTTEQTLRMGNPAQKMETMLNLADAYGIPMRAVIDQAMNGKLSEILQQAHAHHKTPASIPLEVQRELQQHRAWRAQIEDQAATGELEAFAAEEGHEYLDYVREDMADLIEAGVVETYQDAYDLACWRNPQIRTALSAQQRGQQMQSGVARRQAAAAGVVAPSSAPLVDGGETVTADDDTYEAVRKAWNAASTGRI